MYQRIKKYLWQWPDGLVWRLTAPISVASRQRKFAIFMQQLKPTADTTILDVGVSGQARAERAENYLEEWYPYPARITAVGIENLDDFKKRYPSVTALITDGTTLPFPDQHFDIIFSNAVIEHIGDRQAQQRFVTECLRVGRSLFLTTPAREFPIEAHTLIPLAHWLPVRMRNAIYRALGRPHEGTMGYLTLLSARGLRKIFSTAAHVTILRQRLWGWPATLIAIVRP